MTISYLFPSKYKKIGALVLLPSAIAGIIILIYDIEPALLDFKVPAIFIDELFREKQLIGRVNNNILNEIVCILVIVSSILVSFSKEKQEDEFITKIRLESLVWAVYANYAILLLSLLFIFDFSFYWVMLFNMFTVLFFFIIRFNWQLYKLKSAQDEE